MNITQDLKKNGYSELTKCVKLEKNMNYCQCELKKGDAKEIVWIPEKYAKKGKWLKIANDNGWEVIETGSPLSEDYVFGHERDFTKQNKETHRIYKKALNERRIDEIIEAFEDPKKYKRMIVKHYFPLERTLNPFETEEQLIERRYQQILREQESKET